MSHKQITATSKLLTSKLNCKQMTSQANVTTSFGPTSIWPPANDHQQIWYLVKAQALVPQANVGQANILSRCFSFLLQLASPPPLQKIASTDDSKGEGRNFFVLPQKRLLLLWGNIYNLWDLLALCHKN